jgi:prevent-host-death family protein
MRSYPIHEARSKLSTLIARALKGQPQRVTRHGKEAVVIVSEKAWNERPKSAPTLADLFIKTIGADPPGFADVIGREQESWGKEQWAKDQRELGADFAE